MTKKSSIEQAIDDYRNGKMVIVVDDEGRENEGDFIIAAEKATPEDINFMVTEGRGLLCMPITNECAKRLHLTPMVNTNTALHETNFTVSVDAKDSHATGISANDRWKTMKIIIDEDSSPDELARPGHMFPLIAKDGGVLQRAGHTEAAIDLACIAGLKPAALLVEIMDRDGSMARMDRLRELSEEFGLTLISIEDLINYRRKKDKLVEELCDVNMPSKYGNFKLRLFEDRVNGDHHVALVKGDIVSDKSAIVRVHSQCLTGDIFGSLRCDCGEQLALALDEIDKSDSGICVYLRQEGRGIGLKNKILSYKLQEDNGLDTVEANHELGFSADLREYGIGAQILKECGVGKMILLTNNPRKIIGLDGYGLEIVERRSLQIDSNKHNKNYLKTKKDKLGHLLGTDSTN